MLPSFSILRSKYYFFLIFKYLFIWLHVVLITAREIFIMSCRTLQLLDSLVVVYGLGSCVVCAPEVRTSVIATHKLYLWHTCSRAGAQ